MGPQTGTIWDAGDKDLPQPGEGKLKSHDFTIYTKAMFPKWKFCIPLTFEIREA